VSRRRGRFLLLYAQPVTRLSQLNLDDIITSDNGQLRAQRTGRSCC
jgi:hypothetical protein